MLYAPVMPARARPYGTHWGPQPCRSLVRAAGDADPLGQLPPGTPITKPEQLFPRLPDEADEAAS